MEETDVCLAVFFFRDVNFVIASKKIVQITS